MDELDNPELGGRASRAYYMSPRMSSCAWERLQKHKKFLLRIQIFSFAFFTLVSLPRMMHTFSPHLTTRVETAYSSSRFLRLLLFFFSPVSLFPSPPPPASLFASAASLVAPVAPVAPAPAPAPAPSAFLPQPGPLAFFPVALPPPPGPPGPLYLFSRSPTVAADPTAAAIPAASSLRISSVTGHRRAPLVV